MGTCSPLYPYLVMLIGDCFLVGATGGTLNGVLFAPKYADEVHKLLLLVGQLGQYQWVGGLAYGARSDTQILKEYGPQPSHFKKGGVMLLDGSFPGRLHGVIPFPKPKKRKQFARWCAIGRSAFNGCISWCMLSYTSSMNKRSVKYQPHGCDSKHDTI